MYRVTAFIGKIEFRHETSSIAETFEAVKAIVQANKLMLPDQERALDDYFKIVASLAPDHPNKMNMCENFLFRIERLEEEPK